MKKATNIYTKEFNETLKYIGLCLNNRGLNPNNTLEVTGDMIFRSIYLMVKDKKQSQLFWKMVGVVKARRLNKYFKDRIAGNFGERENDMTVTINIFGAELQKQLFELLDKGISEISIMSLMYVSISHMSSELENYLFDEYSDKEIVVNNVEYIVHNNSITSMGLFAFLKTFRKILSELHLDIKKLDMIQMADMQNIDELINNFESDIMDEGDDTGGSTKTKNKGKENQEEHKLTVEHFGIDLTDEARKNHLDPCIGREREIEQLQYTLMRKTKNNPLLIGEAGVGKTAIIEGFAHKINSGDVPERLQGKRIFMLDMGTLVAGTKYRGEFEARFKAIMEEAADVTNNIILFIDEIHTIIGAGSGDKVGDAAQLLKPMLARGKIKLIGATTFDEYQQHIEADAALKRRFQEIHVNEPTPAVTKEILLGLKKHYEDFHGVVITEAAVDQAIKLSVRYMLNKHLPDKAIDVIDEASARQSTKAGRLEKDQEYQDKMKKLTELEAKLESVIQNQDYFAAAEIKKEQDTIKQSLQHINTSKSLPMHMRPIVDIQHIGQVLADKTGLPVDVISESEVLKLHRLQADLEKKIVGQTEAVHSIVKTLQRSRLSVIEHQKPIASFLFLGPSGVGKTYLAKTIAKDYFSDEKALIRVDMSEYMEKHSVSKLIGSAPGYVGYESGGMLTEAVRRKPYSVILLDEIEKASPDVLNILLQILDEGQLKDSKGRAINFMSTIIIMTSNLGHEEFAKKVPTIGFATGKEQEEADKGFDTIKERVMEHVKDFMSPELRNRIDYTIIFKPLTKEVLGDIMKIKLDSFLSQWKDGSTLKLPKFSDEKITEIINEIYDPQYGARPLDKYIHDKIEPSLIQKLIEASVNKEEKVEEK